MAVEKQMAGLSLGAVHRATILRCEVGSTVHGIGVAGTDDRDELGVCIEPMEYVIGLRHFEQHVHRTQPQGVRSQAGDLDLTIYGLRKFASLALKGNPSILLLFNVPDEKCLVLTDLGCELRALGFGERTLEDGLPLGVATIFPTRLPEHDLRRRVVARRHERDAADGEPTKLHDLGHMVTFSRAAKPPMENAG